MRVHARAGMMEGRGEEEGGNEIRNRTLYQILEYRKSGEGSIEIEEEIRG